MYGKRWTSLILRTAIAPGRQLTGQPWAGSLARPLVSIRGYSSSTTKEETPAVTVRKHEDAPEVAIITLHRAAFTHDIARLFLKEWKAMEQDQSYRAVMLKGDHKSIFCAGIDFNEFLKGPESFGDYWRTIRHVFDAIYGSRLNTAASMHGHSLGLGCVLGMACQDRFMMGSVAKPGTIGLNEVSVGVPVPLWLSELFSLITSRRHAERFLPLGRILSIKEAHAIQLVDKIDFSSQQEMDEFVIRYLVGRSQAPRQAQAETIRLIRHNFLEAFRAAEDEDIQNMTKSVASEEAQAVVKEQLAKLANRPKK
ncbi:dodecenoyl-CoA isomerase [Entomortierella beljakovae]|nr:dodecenoyl-CoA isomerase [Entomortierella beljakovae]